MATAFFAACSEFVAALRSFGLELDQSELSALMAEFDEDNNNEIELEEFVMQMKRISRARHQQHEQEQQVQQYASNTTFARMFAWPDTLCCALLTPFRLNLASRRLKTRRRSR